VTTARMLEELMNGYEKAFESDFREDSDIEQPASIRQVTKDASTSSWKTLGCVDEISIADLFGIPRLTRT
jgi:hypothetical protein